MAIPTIKQIAEALTPRLTGRSEVADNDLDTSSTGSGIHKMAEWLNTNADKKDTLEPRPRETRWYFFGDKLDTGDGFSDLSPSELDAWEAVITVTIPDGAEKAEVTANPSTGDKQDFTTSSLHELQAFISQFEQM